MKTAWVVEAHLLSRKIQISCTSGFVELPGWNFEIALYRPILSVSYTGNLFGQTRLKLTK